MKGVAKHKPFQGWQLQAMNWSSFAWQVDGSGDLRFIPTETWIRHFGQGNAASPGRGCSAVGNGLDYRLVDWRSMAAGSGLSPRRVT